MTPRLSSLEPSQVAQVLSAAGGDPVTTDDITSCIELGAPLNDDGTINFLAYTAWLVKEYHGRSA